MSLSLAGAWCHRGALRLVGVMGRREGGGKVKVLFREDLVEYRKAYSARQTWCRSDVVWRRWRYSGGAWRLDWRQLVGTGRSGGERGGCPSPGYDLPESRGAIRSVPLVAPVLLGTWKGCSRCHWNY